MKFTLLFVLAAVGLNALSQDKVMASDRADATSLALAGGKLSEAAAQELENALKQTPDDLSIRTQLLGYYFLRQRESASIRKTREQHVLWVIQNDPEAEIAGTPYAGLEPILGGEAYAQGKTIWEQQVSAHPNDPAILRNAARFFLLNDPALAEDLFKKGAALEPNNPQWPESLGNLYTLQALRKHAQHKSQSSATALKELEHAYALSANDPNKSYMLDNLAKTAYDAGEFDKAKLYADQALDAARLEKNNWHTGNAIHHGNLILGRLALKAGDVEKAKQYLLAAGQTPGSPQLNSFGPNMTLAKELLEKNQSEVVLEYFQLCAKFWQSGADTLRDWTATVNQGGTPDFGANLNY